MNFRFRFTEHMMTLSIFRPLGLALLLSVGFASSATASLTIDFNFSGDLVGDSEVAVANRQAFSDAAGFWEGVITGYADGVSRTVTIESSTFSDGPDENGRILLGEAGPLTVVPVGANFENPFGEFRVPQTGVARFNTFFQDAAAALGLGAATLDPLTIRHEIGHVLGLGTLWDSSGQEFAFNEIGYVEGSGQYFGINALEAYRNEFDPTALFVPVELDGEEGTINAHWNEVGDGGLVVLSGPNQGQRLDDELLTGTLTGSGFLSDTSLGGFRDLGYTTIDFRAVAIPEPSSFALLSCVILVTAVSRRTRR